MDYFRTSGEAIIKTTQLIADIQAFIPAMLRFEDGPEIRQFAVEVHAALREARLFRQDLIAARGPAVLLECYPEDGEVLCRRVDPKNLPPWKDRLDKRK